MTDECGEFLESQKEQITETLRELPEPFLMSLWLVVLAAGEKCWFHCDVIADALGPEKMKEFEEWREGQPEEAV